MRDPNAVVYLVPGVGMLTFARDKATARIAAEFYVNAINVMRGAAGVDSYVGLAEQEAFDIEYWLLEEAKLQRLPKPKALAGRVALVTGGAGGIGSRGGAAAAGRGRLRRADRHRRRGAGPDRAQAGARRPAGTWSTRSWPTSPTSRRWRPHWAARSSGSAGSTSSSPMPGSPPRRAFAETSLADWEKNSAVLAKGVFLVTREAFKVMLTQKLGGSIVTIGSKNALATSGGASAYCAAKAAAVHLTRCIALEGAPHGIRANVVNPDAVLRGSRIWGGDWRKARATGMGIDESQLEEAYRQRSLLKRSVYPEDIAEAVLFLAERRRGEVDRQHPERRRRQPGRLRQVSRPEPQLDFRSARLRSMLVSSSRLEAAIRSLIIVRAKLSLASDARPLESERLISTREVGEALLDAQAVDDRDLQGQDAHHLPVRRGR